MSDACEEPRRESVVHLLHRSGQLAEERFVKEIGSLDLTPRQYIVLAVVAALHSASQTDITKATGIDRSTLSEVVARLVERGFLLRRRSRLDARAYAVRLAPSGQAMLNAVQPIAARVEQALGACLPEQDRRQFIEGLNEILRGHASSRRSTT